MSVGAILHALFLKPLFSIYDAVFAHLLTWTGGAGWALVAFSVVLNLVLLPIYRQMERANRKALQRREEMDREIARIKAHYTGRERYFYVRTVHRVFGYRPMTAVLSSTDLYLQVLVFATVYRFLAGHSGLAGAPFLSIPDLSRPDALVAGMNALPVLMTLLNVGSVAAYAKTAATRRSGFLLAAAFLVLLYRSPSGIVVYWTCNNAFSLVRNLVERKVVPRLPQHAAQVLSRLARQE